MPTLPTPMPGQKFASVYSQTIIYFQSAYILSPRCLTSPVSPAHCLHNKLLHLLRQCRSLSVSDRGAHFEWPIALAGLPDRLIALGTLRLSKRVLMPRSRSAAPLLLLAAQLVLPGARAFTQLPFVSCTDKLKDPLAPAQLTITSVFGQLTADNHLALNVLATTPQPFIGFSNETERLGAS